MDANPQTVLVVTGGDPVAADAVAAVPGDAYVVAADSGLDQALALDLSVDLVVGDFDSVSATALAAAVDRGARVERHPAAKDRTDLELALDAAAALEPGRVVVLGGHGGRLDHFLANVLLLASSAYADLELEAHMGLAVVWVVRRRVEVHRQPGDLLTLVPAHGPARGVRSEGLLYPLVGEDLLPGSTRGVSNELTGPLATITVEHGTVLVVAPGQDGSHHFLSPNAEPRSP